MRACKTLEEIRTIASQSRIELPCEALDFVNGGCGDSKPAKAWYCNKCGAKAVAVVYGDGPDMHVCPNCGMMTKDNFTYR